MALTLWGRTQHLGGYVHLSENDKGGGQDQQGVTTKLKTKRNEEISKL